MVGEEEAGSAEEEGSLEDEEDSSEEMCSLEDEEVGKDEEDDEDDEDCWVASVKVISPIFLFLFKNQISIMKRLR
jgi:hypothetical protein